MKRYILVMLGFLLFNSSALSQNDLHKIHPENDYVYYLDAAVQNEMEGDWFKTRTGSFYLPFINVDNEEIHKFNQNLELLYNTFYPYVVNHTDDEQVYILEAKQFQSEDMMTILIKFYTNLFNYDYSVTSLFTQLPINIDLKENRILSQEEVLERSGYTLTEVLDYIERMTKILGYENYASNEILPDDAVLYWERLEYVNSSVECVFPRNSYSRIAFYKDNNGNLNVLVPIISPKTWSHFPTYYESFVMPLKEEAE